VWSIGLGRAQCGTGPSERFAAGDWPGRTPRCAPTQARHVPRALSRSDGVLWLGARRVLGDLFCTLTLLVTAILVAYPLAAGAATEDLQFCYAGQEAHDAGNYELAVTSYTRCIETGDLTEFNLAVVYFNRANAYSDLNKFDQAIRDYDEAIHLDPKGADLYLNRGLAYANKANYGQAVRDFNEAIDLDRDFGLAYQNRCMAMNLLGRSEEALRDCNESLRLQPGSALALDGRAMTYWLLGKREEAKRDLKEARVLDPSFPDWEERFRQFEKLSP
jgi:tetratricopeptide (TPR) repeat protein